MKLIVHSPPYKQPFDYRITEHPGSDLVWQQSCSRVKSHFECSSGIEFIKKFTMTTVQDSPFRDDHFQLIYICEAVSICISLYLRSTTSRLPRKLSDCRFSTTLFKFGSAFQSSPFATNACDLRIYPWNNDSCSDLDFGPLLNNFRIKRVCPK